MHRCSGALNDSGMVGASLCAQSIRKWLECPSAKAFVKKKELLVQSGTRSPLLVTLCYVLTKVRDACFRKCRH